MADSTNTTTPELDARMKMLEDGFTQLQQENKSLKSALNQASTDAQAEDVPPVIPTESFKVKGKSFKFIAPVFNHNGKMVTAVDALADKTILEELVQRESGLIVQQD